MKTEYCPFPSCHCCIFANKCDGDDDVDYKEINLYE